MIDLADCVFLDQAGLGAIAEHVRTIAARQPDAAVELRNVRPTIEELWSVLGYDDLGVRFA